MITIRVERKKGQIISLTACGHSGYEDVGKDIVCAAVSMVVQTALLGLIGYAGIEVDYKRRDEANYLKFTLPDSLTVKQRQDADAILCTMWLGIKDMHEGFSDFIELEEIENVY